NCRHPRLRPLDAAGEARGAEPDHDRLAQAAIYVRAAVLVEAGAPLVLWRDVDIRPPQSGQGLVKVTYCGGCHSDLSIVDGVFPSPTPIVLGHEAAGVVEAVGPGVKSLEAGDHVVLTPVPPCGVCYFCVRGEPGVCVNAGAIQSNTFADGSTG